MFQIARRHVLETEARRFWYFSKRALGLNANADKNFFPADAALRFMRGDLPKGTRVTTSGRRDGIGMQALSCLSAIAYAHAFEAEYLHTPFGVIDHVEDGGERRWEEFFGFERMFRPSAEFTLIEYGDVLKGAALSPDMALRFQQCWWFTRRYPDAFGEIAPKMRANMAINRTNAQTLKVALHMRRGDVSQSKNNLRFTDEASILRSLACVKASARDIGRDLDVTVFSQGDAKDFRAFADQGCDLKLDFDAIETMRAMMEADVLVMAKSSFSYVSALLNAGTVIYETTFNPPMSHWLAKSADGSVPQDALRAALLSPRP